MASNSLFARVSVIVPAHNAAATLPETIASLRAQTFSGWEAIIVDDGSTDETGAVAAHWAEQEPRVRLLSQPRSGVSAARNSGITAATHDWLLFLDADDWIAPNHLEALARALAADPRLDAVHCGWAWIAPSGETIRDGFGPPGDDLFPVLARRPAFVIHACIVRKALVEAVGAFDPSLATAEDWDLWQRLARCGARFGALCHVLAFYRMRADSATADAVRSLTDGLRVIRRGHGWDSRVSASNPKYAEGIPTGDLPAALFGFLTYYAGVVLGQGGDARPLLRHIAAERAPDLDALGIASILLDAVAIGSYRPTRSWGEFWPAVQPQLSAFLSDLEVASGGLALAPRVQRHLERLILQAVDLRQPVTIGRSHGVRIDAVRPITDVVVPKDADRLHCMVEFAGEPIKRCEFPAFGVVAGETIVDGVAPGLSELTRWTDYALRAHLRAVAHNPRFWRALASFALRRRTLQLGLNFIRKRDGLRRPWLAQWRREGVALMARRRAVIGATRLSRRAQEATARQQAVIAEEEAWVADRIAGSSVRTARDAPTPSMTPGGPDGSSVDETVSAEIMESTTIIGEMTPEAARQVRWSSRPVQPSDDVTERLAILMYHRIAPDGPEALARHRVSPERLRDQLAYLKANGFRSLSLAAWADAIAKRQALPCRAVVLTFDGGYRDFLTFAAPLLERFGFSATVFLVAETVGGMATWDSAYGEPAPLLTWAEIRDLERDGFGFGSHFLRHVPLTALAMETVVREGTRARAILERELEQPVPAIAYPYGDYDPAVGRALRSCGYAYGLTCREDHSRLTDNLMELPRIEVRGSDDIDTFAAKLEPAAGQFTP